MYNIYSILIYKYVIADALESSNFVLSFQLLSRTVPSRSQIIDVLTDRNKELEDIVFQEIDMFLKGLNINIVLLCTFYAENNLESSAKCK